MAHVYDGLKVLDLGQYIAGPLAAAFLADHGAEVIKVERPEGDPYRKEPGFVVWNRGKRSITINLKRKEGQRIAQELAARSDVVIENFRCGVADSLGLGYEMLRALNERLIYCSISGFGTQGPYRDKPGWEPIPTSIASIYADQGGVGKPPVYVVLPLASHYAAMLAAFSITTALLVREGTGRGQRVDIPLLNAMVACQSNRLIYYPRRIPLPSGLPQGAVALYRLYHGSDGQWFFLALGNAQFFGKFAIAMGHEEWVADPLFEGAPWGIYPPRSTQIIEKLQAIFSAKPRDEWLEMFRALDVPCAPARRVDEFLDDPQVQANEMVMELDDPNLGKVRQMGIAIKASLTAGEVRGPSPQLGQHTEPVLAELGYPPSKIARLKAKKVV